MSLLVALLIQVAAAPSPAKPVPAKAPPAATKPAAAPAAPRAPALRPIDSATALDAFTGGCWTYLDDPDGLRAALAGGTLPLVQQPRPEGNPSEQWRSNQAILTYTASDSLPAGVPTRQCVLTVRLSGAVDQLALAARIAAALQLTGGRTRTSGGLSQTVWDAPRGPRIQRLIAATRAAPGGQSDLRLTALLLAPR